MQTCTLSIETAESTTNELIAPSLANDSVLLCNEDYPCVWQQRITNENTLPYIKMAKINFSRSATEKQ